jgi:DNA-binding NarL/FixJ family response regulator
VEPEFEVVRIVHDGLALVTSVCELEPDVVLADISMPELNGIDATRRILQIRPQTKVVLLTMHEEVAYATTALDEGALGYVLKSVDPSELLTAIRQSLLNHVFVTPSLAGDVFRARKNGKTSQSQEFELSTMCREIMRLLTQGLTAKEIASNLGVSPKTVEYHKYKTMRELGLKTSAGLIQYAVKHGIGSS